QLDHFRVTAALEVEHAVVRPTVFVVADQTSFGIGRQRRLSSARQAKEDRDIAFSADVSGAVHAHYVSLRKQIVHDRERALLGFTCVRSAADENEALAEVHQDKRWRTRAVTLWISLEARKVDDREFRFVGLRFFAIADEHRAREE